MKAQINNSTACTSNDQKLEGLSRYDVSGTVLGESIYGNVVKGIDRETKTAVAIKCSKNYASAKVESPSQEVKVLRTLQSAMSGDCHQHPNLLRLIDSFTEADCLYTVLEFMGGGDLCCWIMNNHKKGLPEQTARQIFRQIVQGVAFMHTQGMAHLDISPENVLLAFSEDSKVEAKVCDFGMTQFCNGMSPPAHGSPGKTSYRAPEINAGRQQFNGQLADVFSLGVVLFVLLTGRFPFKVADANKDRRYKEIAHRHNLDFILTKVNKHDTASAEVKELLLKMLALPGKRCSLAEVQQHPWLLKLKETPQSSHVKPPDKRGRRKRKFQETISDNPDECENKKQR